MTVELEVLTSLVATAEPTDVAAGETVDGESEPALKAERPLATSRHASPLVLSNPASDSTSLPTALSAASPMETARLATTAASSAEASASAPRTLTALDELPQQIATMAHGINAEGRRELRVRLDPPSLGEIRVTIEAGKDGLAVRIVAQTREAMLLLQDQRGLLQEELGRNQLRMDSFSASLAGDGNRQRPETPFLTTAPTRRIAAGWSEDLREPAPSLLNRWHVGALDARA